MSRTGYNILFDIYRGPDDIGVHIGDSFWMGHTRLSIVDPSHGHQPLMNREKTR